MLIVKDNLKIRSAETSDVPHLLKWWNCGDIMAHAGFPLGLKTTEEEIISKIENSQGPNKVLIIEEDNKIIGEMNYKEESVTCADIGIKICDKSCRNRGLGTEFVKMLLSELFNNLEFDKVILSTNLNNKRAQHVYEKIGFNNQKIFMNSWKDQLGEVQSHVEYEIFKNQFIG